MATIKTFMNGTYLRVKSSHFERWSCQCFGTEASNTSSNDPFVLSMHRQHIDSEF